MSAAFEKYSSEDIHTYEVGSSLSGKAGYCVALASDSQVDVAGQGVVCEGILIDESATVGAKVRVQKGGYAKAVFGGSVNPGTIVCASASGKIEAASSGDYPIGVCIIDGGADGSVGTIRLGAPGQLN
jgi:hypothetical protein